MPYFVCVAHRAAIEIARKRAAEREVERADREKVLEEERARAVAQEREAAAARMAVRKTLSAISDQPALEVYLVHLHL